MGWPEREGVRACVQASAHCMIEMLCPCSRKSDPAEGDGMACAAVGVVDDAHGVTDVHGLLQGDDAAAGGVCA